MLIGGGRSGYTTLELLVATTLGLVVALAALSLCTSANRLVAGLVHQSARWQELLAAAELWSGEWRGAGYDPTGDAGAGVWRASPELLEFSADWNGDGSLLPTSSNPNERLAHLIRAGEWRRGVNDGPRLPLGWPDSAHFGFFDATAARLDPAPDPEAVYGVEVRAAVHTKAASLPLVWVAYRRSRGEPGPSP